MASPPQPSPALPPPPGQTSNFTNPESLWKWDVLAVTVCLFVTTTVFALRTYVRLGIKREWIFEDCKSSNYMCCISYAMFITYCALMTTVMDRHGGVHEWDLTLPQVHEAIYWFNATSVFYGPTILFTKLSILFLYRRIFSPRRWSPFNIALRLFEVVLILFYLALTIVKIWECSPRARIWDKSIKGKCIDIPSLLNTSGLFNTISDMLILLVPIKSVWNLNMKPTKKLGVIAVFSVGSIAPIFSIIGFVVRIRVSANPDATYNQPSILLWATAEVATGIICVCLPTLAALTHRRPRGPTTSIVNGQSNSRTGRSAGAQSYYNRRKQPHDSDDQTLFHNGDYLELREGANNGASLGSKVPQTAVVTGIIGGARASSTELAREGGGRGDYGEEMEQGVGNIVKTVRIEQSYV